LLTDFKELLIQMLKMPFGISKDGVTASQRIAKTLSQVSLTFNSDKTINPLIDGMDYLASNTKMRDDIKVDTTLMRRHFTYPDHHHSPEEVYIVLSDWFWRHNQEPWWSPGLGAYIYNKLDTPHAMKSVETPLYAI
jgi:hypothetical protein